MIIGKPNILSISCSVGLTLLIFFIFISGQAWSSETATAETSDKGITVYSTIAFGDTNMVTGNMYHEETDISAEKYYYFL